MADCKYSPCAVLPKFKGKSGTPKLSFYPAQLWDEEHDGKLGMWRIMKGSTWHTRPGESVSFFTLEGVTRTAMEHLAAGLGTPLEISGITPALLPKTPVRYKPRGYTIPADTWTRDKPFVDSQGEWRVFLAVGNRNPVLLVDLELRDDPRHG